jgi:hypothetical protein
LTAVANQLWLGAAYQIAIAAHAQHGDRGTCRRRLCDRQLRIFGIVG